MYGNPKLAINAFPIFADIDILQAAGLRDEVAFHERNDPQ